MQSRGFWTFKLHIVIRKIIQIKLFTHILHLLITSILKMALDFVYLLYLKKNRITNIRDF